LSYGGRITLLNLVIPTISLYWLSFFKIPRKIILTIDKLRKRFLWYGGNSVRKKYAFVAWNIVCKSKMQGGLGVIDLTVMNQSFLAKWLYRFQDSQVQGL
jgi:hypothetical protein